MFNRAKDWELNWEAKHNPAIKHGLFGEEDDNTNAGGGTNVGVSGVGNEYDSLGGAHPEAGIAGSELANAGPVGRGQDGADYGNYPGNIGNGAGGDPLGDIFAGLADAEIRAAGIMAEAQIKAAGEIRAGMEAAAKATIEAAKIASAAVLEQAHIADDRLREFWNKARSDLKPIIDQGRYASDEIASMLGIKDSRGRVVEFDQQDLADTPGYQFAFDQGNRALQNSAVGTALSGANARATIEYGQGMANQQFNTRLQQLGFQAEGGWGAARDQANAATQTGNAFANVHSQAGSDLANIQNTKGSNLASIYTSGGNAIASTYMQAGEQRVGLITGLATAGANLKMAEMNNAANAKANKTNGLMGLAGTIIGGYLGGIA